jgi:hypothetical protein
MEDTDLRHLSFTVRVSLLDQLISDAKFDFPCMHRGGNICSSGALGLLLLLLLEYILILVSLNRQLRTSGLLTALCYMFLNEMCNLTSYDLADCIILTMFFTNLLAFRLEYTNILYTFAGCLKSMWCKSTESFSLPSA